MVISIASNDQGMWAVIESTKDRESKLNDHI